MSKNKAYYKTLYEMACSLLEGEQDIIVAMANISALINELVPDLNWAGFYRIIDDKLVLGPFQGKVACTRISYGKGVCGTAWATDKPQLVPNVHSFPGHIACDSASNAEIVIPLHNSNGVCYAVLDIDSPTLNRFDQQDLEGFLAISSLFSRFR